MVTLPEIEEEVVLHTDGGGGADITQLRIFLNERVIERLFELMEANKVERELIDMPCIEIGTCMERAASIDDAGDVGAWLSDLAPQDAQLRVFHDGFFAHAKLPVSGTQVFSHFVTESALNRMVERYRKRLRDWRAEQIESLVDAAMPDGEDAALRPAKAGFSPI